MTDPLSEFYARFYGKKIDVQDNFINYKTGGGEHSNAFAMDAANEIIRVYKLPLKAEMIGFPFKNILHVSLIKTQQTT